MSQQTPWREEEEHAPEACAGAGADVQAPAPKRQRRTSLGELADLNDFNLQVYLNGKSREELEEIFAKVLGSSKNVRLLMALNGMVPIGELSEEQLGLRTRKGNPIESHGALNALLRSGAPGASAAGASLLRAVIATMSASHPEKLAKVLRRAAEAATKGAASTRVEANPCRLFLQAVKELLPLPFLQRLWEQGTLTLFRAAHLVREGFFATPDLRAIGLWRYGGPYAPLVTLADIEKVWEVLGGDIDAWKSFLHGATLEDPASAVATLKQLMEEEETGKGQTFVEQCTDGILDAVLSRARATALATGTFSRDDVEAILMLLNEGCFFSAPVKDADKDVHPAVVLLQYGLKALAGMALRQYRGNFPWADASALKRALWTLIRHSYDLPEPSYTEAVISFLREVAGLGLLAPGDLVKTAASALCRAMNNFDALKAAIDLDPERDERALVNALCHHGLWRGLVAVAGKLGLDLGEVVLSRATVRTQVSSFNAPPCFDGWHIPHLLAFSRNLREGSFHEERKVLELASSSLNGRTPAGFTPLLLAVAAGKLRLGPRPPGERGRPEPGPAQRADASVQRADARGHFAGRAGTRRSPDRPGGHPREQGG